MKKTYRHARAEVIELSLEDVLTASGGEGTEGTVPPNPEITEPPIITGIPDAPFDPDLLDPIN